MSPKQTGMRSILPLCLKQCWHECNLPLRRTLKSRLVYKHLNKFNRKYRFLFVSAPKW